MVFRLLYSKGDVKISFANSLDVRVKAEVCHGRHSKYGKEFDERVRVLGSISMLVPKAEETD